MQSDAGPGQSRLIRAARVYPATGGGAPIRDGVIRLEGSRIAAVGPAAEFQAELDRLPVEHFPDATAMPGLIDAHTHLTLAGDARTYEQMAADPDEMMALVCVMNLQRHLASGVTTVRDNGGRNRVTFIVREAIARGYVSGPRMLLSGRPVTHSLGHFHWCNGTADGHDEIRTAVRKLVAEGADHIKIMASGGATAGNTAYLPSYGVDELRVAVETAHELGRLTTAHCRAKSSIVTAVDAGLDCIEHAGFLVPGPITDYGSGIASSGVMEYDRAVTDRMLEAGVFVSYTLQSGGYDTLEDLRAQATGAALPSDLEQRRSALERYFETKLEIFNWLIRDGMLPRLVVSSDAGPFDIQFGRMHYGLELAVQGGMTPSQAIDATTRIAAEACGMSSLIGTLQVGKEGDIVVVRGDPLTDIATMRNIQAVYQGGVLVSPMVARPAA